MAEIGLIASIVGVAGAGAKAAIALFGVARDLGSAADDVKGLAEDLRGLSHVLHTLSTVLDYDDSRYGQHAIYADDLIKCCSDKIEVIQTMLKKFGRLAQEASLSQRKIAFASRCRWLLYKSRASFLKTSIESLKLTLTLLVSTLQYAQVVASKAPDQIISSFKSQVECQVLDSASSDMSSFMACIEAPRPLDVPEADSWDIEEISSIDDLSIDPSPASEIGDSAAVIRLSSNQQTLAALGRRSFNLPQDSMTLVLQAHDMLRVHRQVSQYAQEMLAHGEDGHRRSWQHMRTGSGSQAPKVPTRQSPTHEPEHGSIPSRGNSFRNVDASKVDETLDSHALHTSSMQSSSKSQPDDEWEHSARFRSILERLAQLEARHGSPSTDNAHPSIGRSSQKANGPEEAQRLAESMREEENRVEEDIIQFKEQITNPQPSLDDAQPLIKFKDAIGRKFNFPWSEVKTWKSMRELLQQAFFNIDELYDEVRLGHYDISGSDGAIILPSVWETTVRSDESYTMHMWPMTVDPPSSSTAKWQLPKIRGLFTRSSPKIRFPIGSHDFESQGSVA